jgi:hypothetical protein
MVTLTAGRHDVDGVGRLAGDLDAIGTAAGRGLRPVGSQVGSQPRDVLDDDGRMPVGDAGDFELQRRHGPFGDAPHGDVEVFGRRLALVGLGDLVQFDIQAGRQLADRRAPSDAQHTR